MFWFPVFIFGLDISLRIHSPISNVCLTPSPMQNALDILQTLVILENFLTGTPLHVKKISAPPICLKSINKNKKSELTLHSSSFQALFHNSHMYTYVYMWFGKHLFIQADLILFLKCISLIYLLGLHFPSHSIDICPPLHFHFITSTQGLVHSWFLLKSSQVPNFFMTFSSYFFHN